MHSRVRTVRDLQMVLDSNLDGVAEPDPALFWLVVVGSVVVIDG